MLSKTLSLAKNGVLQYMFICVRLSRCVYEGRGNFQKSTQKLLTVISVEVGWRPDWEVNCESIFSNCEMDPIARRVHWTYEPSKRSLQNTADWMHFLWYILVVRMQYHLHIGTCYFSYWNNLCEADGSIFSHPIFSGPAGAVFSEGRPGPCVGVWGGGQRCWRHPRGWRRWGRSREPAAELGLPGRVWSSFAF